MIQASVAGYSPHPVLVSLVHCIRHCRKHTSTLITLVWYTVQTVCWSTLMLTCQAEGWVLFATAKVTSQHSPPASVCQHLETPGNFLQLYPLKYLFYIYVFIMNIYFFSHSTSQQWFLLTSLYSSVCSSSCYLQFHSFMISVKRTHLVRN